MAGEARYARYRVVTDPNIITGSSGLADRPSPDPPAGIGGQPTLAGGLSMEGCDTDVARPAPAWLSRRGLRTAMRIFMKPDLDRSFEVLETLQAPA
jgi:hypothetical protein